MKARTRKYVWKHLVGELFNQVMREGFVLASWHLRVVTYTVWCCHRLPRIPRTISLLWISFVIPSQSNGEDTSIHPICRTVLLSLLHILWVKYILCLEWFNEDTWTHSSGATGSKRKLRDCRDSEWRARWLWAGELLHLVSHLKILK